MAGYKSVIFNPLDNSDAASSALAAASDAGSKASTASDKASKASVAAAGVASDASDALSAASDALSKVTAASDKASKASVAAADGSNALSKITARSAVWDEASDASSKASEALSRITARSAVWDRKTMMLDFMGYSSVVADGDGMRFAIPGDLSGFNLVSCGAHVFTPPTSGVMQIRISNITAASEVLTSNLTIDATESDTVTAASQAVIDTGEDDVQTGVELRVYASDAASGAKGLQFRLGWQKP